MSTYNLINGYPGSKAPLAAKISAFFNKDAVTYVEPFVGGGSIGLSLPKGRFEKEIINDKNYGIALLYKCLADDKRRDDVLEALLSIERSPDKEIGREIWNRAKKEYIYDVKLANKEDSVKNCVNAFTVYSQSFNSAGTSYSHHKSPDKYRKEVKRNLTKVVEVLKDKKNLEIRCGEALGLIRKYKDNPDVQIFLDPPYVGLYSCSRENYPVKMVSLRQHIEMLMELRNCKASVVLCGYRPVDGIPCIYDAILSKENWHCFKLSKTFNKAQVLKLGDKRLPCVEYIWTNHVPERAGYHVELYDYKESITWDRYWEKIVDCLHEGLITPRDMMEYCEAYEWFYTEFYGEPKELVSVEEFNKIHEEARKAKKKKKK